MQAHQQVEVSRNDPDLDNLRTFLARDTRKVVSQIAGKPGIDEWLAVASSPDNMHKEAMAHART